MTEEDWLTCAEPALMLMFLRATGKDQKNRLRHFALSCCFRGWHLLSKEGKELLEVVEQMPQGAAARRQRKSALAAIHGLRPANNVCNRGVSLQ